MLLVWGFQLLLGRSLAILWLSVGDGEAAAERLWREAAIRTLPGGYIAHGANGANPGKAYLRVALVHEDAVVAEALERMTRVL